ncbi:hypothetical protein ACVDG3_06795 [Meridianimarinicoccus sp. RP-17]|uniref:hypothetical protein n=1 Tax=Meridianimarinicoccus zhengii TaxID=2056810 RepID=UPI000DAC55A3|nr:hypothetical protein [Phycocomes zhengii]
MSAPARVMRMADDDGAFWAVVREGRILRRYATRSSAEIGLDQLVVRERPKRKERACISCGETFQSEHAGHRMCRNCRPRATLCAQFYG